MLALILHVVVLGLLLGISLIDARTKEIPPWLNVALLGCGVVAVFVVPEVGLVSRFVGLFCVSVPLLLMNLFAGDAFGGGDIKLMAAAGFLLGWQGVVLAVCIGVFIGGVYAGYLIVFKKKGRKEHFAFGPALCAGIATAFFFGAPLIDWCFLGW